MVSFSLAEAQPRTEGTKVEHLVQDKDDRIARVQLLEERQYQELADTATRLGNGLRVNRAALQHLDEQITVEVRRIREDVSGRILRERQDRHAVETQLERLADEKVALVHGYLAEEAQMQRESERYTQGIRDEVCRLYADVEQARQYRIEQGQKLAEAVKLKLGEIRDAVAAEQRIRLESQNTLLELFGQMGQKMEQELENSRRERHLSTDRVIALMETVLPKMDAARRRGVEVCHETLHDHSEARDMASTATENFRKSSIAMTKGTLAYKGSVIAM
mmetsp:Transcript_40330/g.124619  ORF Transcript_40330/g.124619 Transcript_40330/m.124619 type:complete len:277 (+) Transcript_40330:78-908(+)